MCESFAGNRLVLLLLLSAGASVSAQEGPPNVVYFMADELGYYELSCMGHPHLQTPRMDRLAAEGVRFTRALAGSSVCAPTRCCLMTGKHSGHTSVRSNGGGTPLRAGEPTIASVLKQAGYATGGFGKWGCGGRGSTGVPELHGFDVFYGYYDQVHAHSYYPPYLIRNSVEAPLPGNRGGRSGETYSHYSIMEEALQFIRRNRDQPFFCYLPVTPPHGMFDIPDEDPAWRLYRDQPWSEDAKRYAAMVSMVDRNVGEVLDLLRELNLDERTIVFFSGDNGGNDYFKTAEHPRGFHRPNVDPRSGVEFRGTKGTLYEGGLRVPFIVRWPGRIDPGRTSDLLCYFPDVLPTIAELCGGRPPEDLDGLSLVPELLGPRRSDRGQPQHEYLYWELGGWTAIRQQDWKAVRSRPNGPWELYDLAADPSESRDLASERSDVLRPLTELAGRAHEPVQEGEFADREAHERDRRAKWGDTQPPAQAPPGKKRRLDRTGLLSSEELRLVRVSSESKANGKLARLALDQDPATHWHTDFSGDGPRRHPHELVLDLGRTRTVRGVRYLARQDGGWNGAAKACEIYIGDNPDVFGEPAASFEFRKTKESQEALFQPETGRYVRIVFRSEVNGGPWASAAEIGVVGE